MVIQPAAPKARTAPGATFSIRVEAPAEFSIDADIRKLLDRMRVVVGDRLLGRGRSDPKLEALWRLAPITGGALTASTAVETDTRTGDAYLARVGDAIVAEVSDAVISDWLDDAAPRTGDGVNTETAPNTSGGRIPLPKPTR